MFKQLFQTAAYFQTPPPEIEVEFRRVVLTYIWPASILLLILHILLTISYLFPLSNIIPAAQIGVTAAAGLVVLAGVVWQLRQPVSPDSVYVFSFVFLGLPIIFDNLAIYYLTMDPFIIVQVFIASMLMGYFILDSRWMIWLQILNLVPCAALVVAMEGAAVLLDYITFGSGTLLGAFFLHVAHRQTLLSQLELRHKEQHARQIATGLQAVGAALTSSLSRSRVIQGILDNLSAVLASDRLSILIQEGEELVVAAALGFPEGIHRDGETRIFIGDANKDDIYPTIVRTQRAVIVPDVGQRPDWVHVEGLPPAVVYMGLPLLAQNEVIGILSLVRTTSTPFTPEEIHSAELFANQAAIALQNAALYERVTAFNQTLEREVEERTADLEKAYHQLARLDQAKSDFITIMSHEIRTPLTVLRGYIQMLGRDDDLLQNERRSKYIRGIDAGSLRLQELVESLFILVRIENETLDVYWSELHIGDLLNLVGNQLEPVFKGRRQTFVIEEAIFQLPPIVGDYDLLETVFNQLLLNAVKYTPDRGKIEICGRVAERAVGGRSRAGLEICVADTGIGVAPELNELIFTKFYQAGRVELHSSSKTKFKGGGAGLGLSIAKGIVDLHQGDIWVESAGLDEEKLPGSRFFVWLPLERGEIEN